jgi:hypothetical protein
MPHEWQEQNTCGADVVPISWWKDNPSPPGGIGMKHHDPCGWIDYLSCGLMLR